MPQYDNTNKGAIWKNDRKETDNQPDYKGNANIDGVDYWVNAWRGDTSKENSPVLKFSFKRKDEAAVAQNKFHGQPESNIDADIPF